VEDQTLTLYSLEIPVLLIEPPGGTTENVLEVDQTQTTKGYTFTINYVDIRSWGTHVYGFLLLPDDSPYKKIETEVFAEYSIDGTVMPGPVVSEKRSMGREVPLSWGYLNPVPRDARELTLTITEMSIGGEITDIDVTFNIPLQ
jgi:hypothetical protein